MVRKDAMAKKATAAAADKGPTTTTTPGPETTTTTDPGADQVMDAVAIEVPVDLAEAPQDFMVHLDFKLSGEEATTLRRIYVALDKQGAVTNGGRRVTSYQSAIKWLLAKVQQQLEPVDPAT